MSASQPGNMRGPRVKTPLLVLLLLTSLTGTVLCQEEEGGGEESEVPEVVPSGTDLSDTEPPEFFTPSTTIAQENVTPPIDGDGVEDLEDGSGQHRSLFGANDYSLASTEDPSVVSSTMIPGEEDQNFGLIIPVLVVLVVVIIGMIGCGLFISRRWNKKPRNQELKKEDPFLDGSSTEKVPMPMFEEDVPSVLELEMEELDQWMKKDGETADDSKNA